jgi:hypothetical protein
MGAAYLLLIPLLIMATKIYKLNQKKNVAIFDIPANDGKMMVTFTFKDGNQFMPNMPARCVLRNEFYQSLLEKSDLFKRGIIVLERTIDDGGAKDESPKEPKKQAVDEVTSPEQAIEYVFNTWGVVVKSGKQAIKIASQKGVEFPFLKEKNNDK